MTGIILEGPDGVGKTTFGKYLESQGWYYQHFPIVPQTNADGFIQEMIKWFPDLDLKLLQNRNLKVVIDRFWLSTIVYQGVDLLDPRLDPLRTKTFHYFSILIMIPLETPSLESFLLSKK